MTWYTRQLKDDITYWAPPNKNEWADQTYPSPATIRGHWKDEDHSFTSPDGTMQASRATVLLDQNVNADGFLLLGVSSSANPRLVLGTQRIIRVDKLPSHRRHTTVFVAFI